MLTGGDFNGDGRSDLVLFVTQPDLSTKPMVVLMQSDGTLGAPIALPASVPTANIQGAIAADFTGDGKLDLAIRRFDTTVGNYVVQVLIGNGDGTFQAGPVSAAVGSSVSMAVGDFNGDHHADLVLGQQSAFTFKVLLGNGDGSFGAPAVYSLPTSLPAITVGDFNRDGRDDLAVTNGQFGTSPIGTDVYLAAPGGRTTRRLRGRRPQRGRQARPGQARQPCRDLDYRLGAPQQRRWDVRGEPRAGRSKPRLRGPGGSPPQWRSRPRRCAGRHS
jgi:hypothetical protein